MASTYPRFGFNNAFIDNGYGILESDAVYPPARLFNPRLTSKFRPSTIAYSTFIETQGKQSTNMLNNWFFGMWTNGTSAAPDAWTCSKTPSRTATSKVGYSACWVTPTSDETVSQTVTCPEEAKGRLVSFGCWVSTNTASKVRVSVTDGTTTTYTSYNAAGAGYEWLSATLASAVSLTATELTFTIHILSSATFALLDGASLVIGDSVSQTPEAISVDYVAIAGHDMATNDMQIKVQSSDDNWSSTTTHATVTPTEDITIFKSFTSASAKAWRVLFETTDTYSKIPSIAVLSMGEMLEMPEYVWSNFDPLQETINTKQADSFTGYNLGVDVRERYREFPIVFKYLSRSFITGADWQAFMDWAIRARKPFFFAHNEGLFPDEVYYLNIRENDRFSAKLKPRALIDTVTLNVKGIIE